MTNSPFEVPNELRDFAERSVEQARKAFEGFLAVAQRTADAAGDAANTTQAGAKSVGAHVLAYAEQNVNAAFELANKVIRAKPAGSVDASERVFEDPARRPADTGQRARRHPSEKRHPRLTLSDPFRSSPPRLNPEESNG